MKCVLLAGGKGTRIQELTYEIPKPLLEVRGIPMLLHIMDSYSLYGVTEFIILVGYRGHLIKEYFTNFLTRTSDLYIDLQTGQVENLNKNMNRNYKISIIETGDDTPTGERLLRARPYLENETNFFLTYGDGLSNVNIGELYDFHISNGLTATVTGVKPPGRFGAISERNGHAIEFIEKPQGDGFLINGGFFVFNKNIFSFLTKDSILEQDPLKNLTAMNQLAVYVHNDFWKCVDTLRDLKELNEIAEKGEYPWFRES